MRMNRLVAVLVSFLLVLLGLGGSPAVAADEIPDPTAPSGSVQGLVTTPDGGPVSGVDVLLRVAPEDDPISRATTDAAGSYVMDGVADGTYRVQFVPTAQASGSDLAAQFFDGAPTWDDAVDVIVAGAAVNDIDAVLVPAASPQTATDPSAEPVVPPSDEPALPSPPAPSEGSSGDPGVQVPTDQSTPPSPVDSQEASTGAAPAPDGSASQEPSVTPSAASESPTAEPTNSTTPEQPGADAPAISARQAPAEAPMALLADAPAGTISGMVTQVAGGAAVPYASVTLYKGVQYYPGGPTSWNYSSRYVDLHRRDVPVHQPARRVLQGEGDPALRIDPGRGVGRRSE